MKIEKYEYDDFELVECVNNCRLLGRFIRRASSGNKTMYQISVEQEDPLIFFVVEYVAPYIVMITNDAASVKNEMQKASINKAKEILTNGYENGRIYPFDFKSDLIP